MWRALAWWPARTISEILFPSSLFYTNPMYRSFLVEFATEAAAANAVSMFDDKLFTDGNEKGMRVVISREPLEREVIADAVYVRNLAREATEEDVTSMLASAGPIKQIRMVPRRG